MLYSKIKNEILNCRYSSNVFIELFSDLVLHFSLKILFQPSNFFFMFLDSLFNFNCILSLEGLFIPNCVVLLLVISSFPQSISCFPFSFNFIKFINFFNWSNLMSKDLLRQYLSFSSFLRFFNLFFVSQDRFIPQ